jgi:hypothetical protein
MRALIKSSRSTFYGNITISGICLFRLVELKEAMKNMDLFKRDKAIKKWHGKAWMVNPRKTKIVLVAATTRKPKKVLVAEAAGKRKHVPPWIFKKLDTSIKDMYAQSIVRMQYCSPVGCPSSNATETSDRMKEGTLPF